MTNLREYGIIKNSQTIFCNKRRKAGWIRMPRVLTETKHYQTATLLRQFVNTLPVGERLPVTSELMEMLNASHGTVIQALKTLSSEGVIQRQFGKQRYFVAERFDRSAAKICVIRPDYPSIAFDAMLRSVYEAGQDKNWRFLHQTYRSFEEMDLQKMIGSADACILLPSARVMDREMLRILKRPSRPVAVLLQHVDLPEVANVTIDDAEVGRLAARTLFSHGHRRILVLRDQPHESTTEERLRGFFSMMAELGVPETSVQLLDAELNVLEGSLEGSYECITKFLDEQENSLDFTAVFTLSLSGGAAVLRALREHERRVPEEISVLSYGGEASLAPYLNPPLSTIEISTGEFGVQAVRLIDGMLHSIPFETLQYRISPKLVLRKTLQCIK